MLILAEWIKSAEGEFKVIAHFGSNNQRDAIEWTFHTATAGSDCIGCVVPHFLSSLRKVGRTLVNY